LNTRVELRDALARSFGGVKIRRTVIGLPDIALYLGRDRGAASDRRSRQEGMAAAGKPGALLNPKNAESAPDN